jgi:hypothetical protein
VSTPGGTCLTTISRVATRSSKPTAASSSRPTTRRSPSVRRTASGGAGRLSVQLKGFVPARCPRRPASRLPRTALHLLGSARAARFSVERRPQHAVSLRPAVIGSPARPAARVVLPRPDGHGCSPRFSVERRSSQVTSLGRLLELHRRVGAENRVTASDQRLRCRPTSQHGSQAAQKDRAPWPFNSRT